MTVAWRLDKAKRTQADSFSGNGAQISGGRWNRKGFRAVYLSESLALAALEKFVHTQEEGRLIQLVSYKVEIPDSIRIDQPAINDLPPHWRREPPPNETQDFGTGWLKKGSNSVLRIPSAVVPGEFNLMLNPGHEDFLKIKIAPRQPFTFDPQMWK